MLSKTIADQMCRLLRADDVLVILGDAYFKVSNRREIYLYMYINR